MQANVREEPDAAQVICDSNSRWGRNSGLPARRGSGLLMKTSNIKHRTSNAQGIRWFSGVRCSSGSWNGEWKAHPRISKRAGPGGQRSDFTGWPPGSLRPAKFFFQFAEVHFDAAWAGHAGRCRASRSGADPQRDSPVRARPADHWPSRRGGKPSWPRRVRPGAGRFTSWPAAFSSSTSSSTNRRAIAHLHERRQRIEQKRAFAKFAQAHAEPRQRGEMIPQKMSRRGRKARPFLAAAGVAMAPAHSAPADSASARKESARAPRADRAGPVRDPIPAPRKVCQSRRPAAAARAAAGPVRRGLRLHR